MIARTTLGAINWGAFARILVLLSIGFTLIMLFAVLGRGAAVQESLAQGNAMPANNLEGKALQGISLPQAVTTGTPGVIFHANGETESGFVTAYIPGTSSYTYLSIYRFTSLSASQTQTVLAFYSYNDTTQTYDCAYGLIPSGDLTGNSASRLVLNTNTSTNTDPNFYRCGPGGVITVTFRTIGLYGGRSTNNSEYHFGNLMNRSTGQFQVSSAIASGSILGMAIQGAAGELDRGHSVNLTIQRGP
jgi:hypothetical protein